MDINKKLSYYRSSPQTKPDNQSSSLQALQEIFSGSICAPSAPYLKIDREYSLDAPKVVRLQQISKGVLSGPLELDQCLFFDLETTGLAGGTGTFPFLFGFGYFSAQKFHVELFFLPDFGREYYLYQYLQELFSRFSCLVSFNGKSFDLPLLKNRFILNRFKIDWDRFEHLDLLHLSRRIWKDSYPSLELKSIEVNLLNRFRKDDIPGAMIPESYFTFLKTGVIHNIRRVIEHNYLDIISLVDLILLLNDIEENPSNIEDERVLIRLARLHFETGNVQGIEDIGKLFLGRHKKIPQEIRYWQGISAKRAANWSQAVEIWEELSQTKTYHYICLEELAKYYEHQIKDFKSALAICERALKNIKVLQELNPYSVPENLLESFLKRADRLRIKIA